jgi:hypothetical protein
MTSLKESREDSLECIGCLSQSSTGELTYCNIDDSYDHADVFTLNASSGREKF